MSYDFYFTINAGGKEPSRVGEEKNYTSNVSCMWRIACPEWDTLDGMKCSDLAPIMKSTLERMISERKVMEKLESENGWGSYKGAREVIIWILDQCDEHPEATFRWSR